jgi:uncharacterized protein YndB with AHSA1/START domain
MNVQDPVSITLSYTFEVNPETVFDAWVRPDQLRKWLFVGASNEIEHVELDLRVGGKFSIHEYEKSSGQRQVHEGKYLEIEPHKKLVLSLTGTGEPADEVIITVEFSALAAGAELRLSQTGVSGKTSENNWKMMLEQLRLSLEVW